MFECSDEEFRNNFQSGINALYILNLEQVKYLITHIKKLLVVVSI